MAQRHIIHIFKYNAKCVENSHYSLYTIQAFITFESNTISCNISFLYLLNTFCYGYKSSAISVYVPLLRLYEYTRVCIRLFWWTIFFVEVNESSYYKATIFFFIFVPQKQRVGSINNKITNRVEHGKKVKYISIHILVLLDDVDMWCAVLWNSSPWNTCIQIQTRNHIESKDTQSQSLYMHTSTHLLDHFVHWFATIGSHICYIHTQLRYDSQLCYFFKIHIKELYTRQKTKIIIIIAAQRGEFTTRKTKKRKKSLYIL